MFEDFFLHPENDDELSPPVFSIEESAIEGDTNLPTTIPLLALKNTVLFPTIAIPITVAREKSIKAISEAYEGNRYIAVLSQKNSQIEDPIEADLYAVGTVAKIVKVLKMPDGTATTIIKGEKRFKLKKIISDAPFLQGEISYLEDEPAKDTLEFKAVISAIKDKARKIIDLSPHIPREALGMLKEFSNNVFLLHFIASNLGTKIQDKQNLLEIDEISKRSEAVLQIMDEELKLLKIKDKIENKVKGDIEKQQRDYFLNQQLKTIQEELGQNPYEEQIQKLKDRAAEKKWSKKVEEAFFKELNRVKRMNPQVAEYSVVMNYLELMLDLPWEEFTKDNFNLKKVKGQLDKDHYGLEKVKERILEHLAVLKLKGDMKAPIICLVGPPGVGKTSLGRSIADALKRKFIRMSLGGLHDESEIRGHRKTYIGAMPGRIIQSLKKVQSSNPVFILDEIDKVGKSFRGDPSSALLEVLDPEQNSTFHDNYLDIEYDLSKVLFIATANSLSTIQPALLDRMEIIQISGYSQEEKIQIAKNYLIPEQRKEHGLEARDIKLKDDVIAKITKEYTRESGVRSLNRRIARVMRSTAKKVAMEETYSPTIKIGDLKDILGPTQYNPAIYQEQQKPGVAVGLAWTKVGGDILFIESSLNKGKGKLTLTGNLGDVMKESATTALSYLKANSKAIGLDATVFEENDIHIHVPEGAIPKDGPSAGITMMTALASVANKQPVKPYVAMTGEITLRGIVLPVGGIKEKILAAKRSGIKEIILCKENKKHIEEIETEYIKDLTFHFVENMIEVLDIAVGF